MNQVYAHHWFAGIANLIILNILASAKVQLLFLWAINQTILAHKGSYTNCIRIRKVTHSWWTSGGPINNGPVRDMTKRWWLFPSPTNPSKRYMGTQLKRRYRGNELLPCNIQIAQRDYSGRIGRGAIYRQSLKNPLTQAQISLQRTGPSIFTTKSSFPRDKILETNIGVL